MFRLFGDVTGRS